MYCRGEELARHVFPGVDAMDTGDGERLGGVDGGDAGMCVRRVQHFQVQHAVDRGVHSVFGSAGHHVGGRRRPDAGSDGLSREATSTAPTPLTASSMDR